MLADGLYRERKLKPFIFTITIWKYFLLHADDIAVKSTTEEVLNASYSSYHGLNLIAYMWKHGKLK